MDLEEAKRQIIEKMQDDFDAKVRSIVKDELAKNTTRTP